MSRQLLFSVKVWICWIPLLWYLKATVWLHLQCGAREVSDRMGSIFGTKGYIQVQNINNPEKITVFDKEHKEVAAYMPPAQITGYEYEVEACARAIAQGEKECPEMPHDETVRVMEIMDGIRKSWGYEIPLYE